MITSKEIVALTIFNNAGITRDGVREKTLFDVNQYKVNDYIDELKNANLIKETDYEILNTNHAYHDAFRWALKTYTKRVSAGVIVKQDNKILLIHPTGQLYWDIPKGRIDENESAAEAAIRELSEETGLSTIPSNLVKQGTCNFNRFKDIIVYLWTPDKLKVELECTSYFRMPDGRKFPEADAFAWVDIEMIHAYLPPSLASFIDRKLR